MIREGKHHLAPPPAADSIDLEAVRIYFDSPEFRDAVAAPDFEARCVALFNAFDAGRLMTLVDAADFLGLPWEALGVLMAILAPSYIPGISRRVMQ